MCWLTDGKKLSPCFLIKLLLIRQSAWFCNCDKVKSFHVLTTLSQEDSIWQESQIWQDLPFALYRAGTDFWTHRKRAKGLRSGPEKGSAQIQYKHEFSAIYHLIELYVNIQLSQLGLSSLRQGSHLTEVKPMFLAFGFVSRLFLRV